MGFALATLLANAVFFSVIASMPEDQFLQWGWRIPFLFGGVCVLVGYFIRRGVEEPPVYERAVEQAKTEKIGLFTSIKRNPRSFVIVLLTRMGENGFAYLYPVFCVSYVITTLGQPRSTALWAVIIASMVQVATIPFFGVLSDRLGRKTVYIAGALLSMAWLVPFFLLLDTGATAAIILGFGIGLGIAYPAMLAPQASWYAELFDTQFRLSGFAFSRELGSLLAGGVAPFIATALVAWAHHWWPIVAYMWVLGIITLIGLKLGPETVSKKLGDRKSVV